jgi:hypothetical protein
MEPFYRSPTMNPGYAPSGGGGNAPSQWGGSPSQAQPSQPAQAPPSMQPGPAQMGPPGGAGGAQQPSTMNPFTGAPMQGYGGAPPADASGGGGMGGGFGSGGGSGSAQGYGGPQLPTQAPGAGYGQSQPGGGQGTMGPGGGGMGGGWGGAQPGGGAAGNMSSGRPAMGMPSAPAPMQMGPTGPMIHDGQQWHQYDPANFQHVHAAYGGNIPPGHPVMSSPGGSPGGPNMPNGMHPINGGGQDRDNPYRLQSPQQQAADNAARQARIAQDAAMHRGEPGAPQSQPPWGGGANPPMHPIGPSYRTPGQTLPYQPGNPIQ